MLLLSWNSVLLPVSEQPCAGLVIGEGNASFHTLHVKIHDPAIITEPGIRPGFTTD